MEILRSVNVSVDFLNVFSQQDPWCQNEFFSTLMFKVPYHSERLTTALLATKVETPNLLFGTVRYSKHSSGSAERWGGLQFVSLIN